jgi:hypothetical protein
MTEVAVATARKLGLATAGQTIAIAAGMPFGASGITNLLHIAQAEYADEQRKPSNTSFSSWNDTPSDLMRSSVRVGRWLDGVATSPPWQVVLGQA